MSDSFSVFMGGFPHGITLEKINQFLTEKKFPPTSFDLKDKTKFAFGFATYKTKEEAEAAVNGLKDSKYEDNPLTINLAEVINKIYIGKLPEVTLDELKQIIKDMGITNCEISLKSPNKKKVQAFMIFPDADARNAALTNLKSVTFGDRRVFAKRSKFDEKKAVLINFPFSFSLDILKKNLADHSVNPTEISLSVPMPFAFLDFKDKVEDFNKAMEILTKTPKIKDAEVRIRKAYKQKSKKSNLKITKSKPRNNRFRKDFVIKVTNVPKVISESDVKSIFENFKTQHISIVRKEKEAIVYVSFATFELRNKAFAAAKGTRVESKEIVLRKVKSNSRFNRSRRPRRVHKPTDPKSKTTLYITNLSFSVNENALREAFSKYSPVSVYIPRNRYNKSRGIAFITFNSEDVLNNANSEMNNASIKERPIITQIAYERPTKK